MEKNYVTHCCIFFLIFTSLTISAQVVGWNPEVFNKEYPEIISVANQAEDFRFTSHIVNIKVPTNIANNWTEDVEMQYIQNLFNFIPDKDFLIINYSGFWFPPSTELGMIGAHHIIIQNNVENIGLWTGSNAEYYNSNDLLGITRLKDEWGMRPSIVTHELFHQWNSYLESAKYWLIEPDYHTGLVEESTSVFENYRNTFEHVEDTIYSYRQHYSGGFVGTLEGYLSGLWDMPDTLRTLKNYYHYPSLPSTNMGDYYLVQVKADGIVDLNKNQLFSMYGGERIPNYEISVNNYDNAVIIFSVDDFLDDNLTKGFHYASIVNETEDPNSNYNEKYDEVFTAQVHSSQNNPEYGLRVLNPYHASYKNLHFQTLLFNATTGVSDNEDKFFSILYPNPTNNSFLINSNSKIESISIYDISGKLIKIFDDQNEYDVSGFSTGLYLVKIKTEIGSSVEKLVIE